MLHKLFKRNSAAERQAAQLYQAIVATARLPHFYKDYQVPDTPLGRFEMLSVITALMLFRLKHATAIDSEYDTHDISQEIVDNLIADLDACVREITNEDLKAGHRVKKMAQSFYGRLISFHNALSDADVGAIKDVLLRNTYGFNEASEDTAFKLAGQILLLNKKLAKMPLKAILKEENFI